MDYNKCYQKGVECCKLNLKSEDPIDGCNRKQQLSSNRRQLLFMAVLESALGLWLLCVNCLA